MKQILAIVRQLLTEVKEVTQESMDINPTNFTKRSGFVKRVEWRVNHLFEELKEAINVENNGREERNREREYVIQFWKKLADERLETIADREVTITQLLSRIEMKDEIIRQERLNIRRFLDSLTDEKKKNDTMRRKSAQQSRRIAELTRGVGNA